MEETDKYLDAFRTTLPVLIDKEMNKVRKQQRGLILLVCVLLATNLLLLGGTLWVLRAPKPAVPKEVSAATEVVAKEETEAVEEPEEPEEAAPVFTAETVAEPDTEEAAEDSDPLIAAAGRAAELAVERSRAENQVERADAVATVQKKDKLAIPAHVITERGMTLRSLARHYYGHEVFWVCIYDRNIEVLSSPDVLPQGIRLYLPRPADYGIDANDPSSLQRARKLGRSLME